MANRDNLYTGTGVTGSPNEWASEELYWRDNWTNRPYISADRGFDYYRPGYLYGYEAASRYRNRNWDDIEPDLRSGWDRFEHRGESTWENVKDAVRDAWHRVTHR